MNDNEKRSSERKLDENIRRLHMFRALDKIQQLANLEKQQEKQDKKQVAIILVILFIVISVLTLVLYTSSYTSDQKHSPSAITPAQQQ